jgi:hypothetical protein
MHHLCNIRFNRIIPSKPAFRYLSLLFRIAKREVLYTIQHAVALKAISVLRFWVGLQLSAVLFQQK